MKEKIYVQKCSHDPVLIAGKIETIPQQGNGYDHRAPWKDDY